MCLFQPSFPRPSHPRTPAHRVDPLSSDEGAIEGPTSAGFLCRSLSFSVFLFLPFPPHCLALSAPCSRRRDTHHGVVYLLLASPLNGISVLSDGPRAELRPCASLARFLLPSLLIPESSLREYIARAASADARSPLLPSHSLSLSLFAARAIAITMRYEVDIVTNVMEPGTIFRARSFEVREEKGQRSSG